MAAEKLMMHHSGSTGRTTSDCERPAFVDARGGKEERNSLPVDIVLRIQAARSLQSIPTSNSATI